MARLFLGSNEVSWGGPSYWERSADWLDLTEPASTSYFVGLMGVMENGPNFASFYATLSGGTYTIDWGDGTVVSGVASGVISYHEYSWDDLGADTEASVGGITMRQALVTVTLTSTNTFVNVYGFYKHTSDTRNVGTSNWLDMKIKSASINNFRPSYGATGSSGAGFLQRVIIDSNDLNSAYYMFYTCYNLQKIVFTNPNCTNGITDATAMFMYCVALREIPWFDASTITNGTYMFYAAYVLERLPNLQFTSITNPWAMFINCRALKDIPNTFAATLTVGPYYFANYCQNLRQLPDLNTQNITDFRAVVAIASTMQELPDWNTASGTNWDVAFQGANTLTKIPWNTNACTSANSMFLDNIGIAEVNMDASHITSATTMFRSNYSLQKCLLSGMRFGVTLTDSCMGSGAIVDMFNSFGTASGAQTITLTRAPGASQITVADIAIATGKGYTVIT